jgi:hypothetical protein
MKFIESVTGIAIAAAVGLVINENHKTPDYGTILNEVQQQNGEVSIGIKTKEGGRNFSNCDPQLLRRELGLSPRDQIKGGEIKYPQIEVSCPADPNLLKAAKFEKK